MCYLLAYVIIAMSTYMVLECYEDEIFNKNYPNGYPFLRKEREILYGKLFLSIVWPVTVATFIVGFIAAALQHFKAWRK